ncbi:hypothetical protein Ddye_007049 [Dipteronia dyeriana]|uniref:Uncharacterized protein n=1 Tax=Dipteronia dyeriana TaxID=168575 RepID=A0AAD9XJS9_9ROSI|nr:hypothetical protein Ddye_007049 [Dipteronia dyeriana]
MSTRSHGLGEIQSSANTFFSTTISYLSFFGVSALNLIYVVILYLVIDFNFPAYGITTTPSSTTTEDRLSGMSLEEIKDLPSFDCRVNIASICVVWTMFTEGIDAGDFRAATMFFMHNVLILC